MTPSTLMVHSNPSGGYSRSIFRIIAQIESFYPVSARGIILKEVPYRRIP